MNSMKGTIVCLIFFMIGVSSCKSMQEPGAIFPIQEYEKLLMGRLDANYIGTDNCLASCHYHDKIRADFDASTMGSQMSAESGMPLVNCESCHGPGSLAVEGLSEEKVTADKDAGIITACNYETLIDLKNIAPQAQALLCLKCHTKNATFNLHNWMAGAHSINDVSCFDCHNLHAGPVLITEPQETKDMCLRCHQQQQAEFSLPSTHPVLEKKLFCTDCHNPHGTVTEGLLVEDTVKETCTRCHGEKEGPFVFEHADMNEDCTFCHNSHGSVNNNLLTVSEPFLCLQCHGGHRTSSSVSTLDSKGAYYTRCTDCHSQIHGTDLPSTSGEGMFLN